MRRFTAAQETVAHFKNTMLVSKKSNGPHYDSDSSSCGGQDGASFQSPSPASLNVFINALPYCEPLHFGFYLLKDDKRPSCLCPCARHLTSWRTSFNIDMEKGEWCKFHLYQSSGLLQYCSSKGDSYHNCVM